MKRDVSDVFSFLNWQGFVHQQFKKEKARKKLIKDYTLKVWPPRHRKSACIRAYETGFSTGTSEEEMMPAEHEMSVEKMSLADNAQKMVQPSLKLRDL